MDLLYLVSPSKADPQSLASYRLVINLAVSIRDTRKVCTLFLNP